MDSYHGEKKASLEEMHRCSKADLPLRFHLSYLLLLLNGKAAPQPLNTATQKENSVWWSARPGLQTPDDHKVAAKRNQNCHSLLPSGGHPEFCCLDVLASSTGWGISFCLQVNFDT